MIPYKQEPCQPHDYKQGHLVHDSPALWNEDLNGSSYKNFVGAVHAYWEAFNYCFQGLLLFFWFFLKEKGHLSAQGSHNAGYEEGLMYIALPSDFS